MATPSLPPTYKSELEYASLFELLLEEEEGMLMDLLQDEEDLLLLVPPVSP